MKCIGKKCIYYSCHDFYISYGHCNLDNTSFKEDDFKNKNCRIDNLIRSKIDDLEKLKDYKQILVDFNAHND